MGGVGGGWGGGLNNFNDVHAPVRKVVWGGWGVGGLNNVHAAWSSLCVLRCRSMAKCNACNVCGFGSDIMKRDDVALVCVLVLLLRLGRFPEPIGFAELRPLFRICVYAQDAYVDGLCVDVRDDVQRFVVEATLQVESSWVNWGLVAAARLVCLRIG